MTYGLARWGERDSAFVYAIDNYSEKTACNGFPETAVPTPSERQQWLSLCLRTELRPRREGFPVPLRCCEYWDDNASWWDAVSENLLLVNSAAAEGRRRWIQTQDLGDCCLHFSACVQEIREPGHG